MRRSLLRFTMLLALAGAALVTACSGGAAQEQPTPTPLPTPMAAAKPTYTVKRGDILAQVQFNARVMPSVQQELYFQANGRVREVYVANGEAVKQGQVLADLLQLNEMEAQAREQELTLRKAEINLEMAWLRQQLAATQTPNWNNGYDIQMKMKEYEVELAQIALEETQLKAQSLDTEIEAARIVSPLDGKVLSVGVFEGTEVKAYSPLITVGDDTNLEVGATLTSAQMEQIAEGMETVIELPNRPGERLSGLVRSLPYPYGTSGGTMTGANAAAQKASGAAADTTTRVQFDDSSAVKDMKVGDLVQVTVIMESKQGVLWLPPQAIRNFEGRNFVVVQTDGLPRRVDVRLGIRNDEMVEILEGLEEGQVAIAP